MEDERVQRLRKTIQEIQKDASLTPMQKAKKIQLLMSGKNPNDVKEPEEAPIKRKPVEELDRSLSYYNVEQETLGCKHYQRGCKIRAYCCGELFGCRFCHDEQVTSHKINRHETEEMLCMSCGELQSIAQICGNKACSKVLGKYYCNVCKFHDNDEDKNIYHCPECGICRVGKGLGIDFFHCPKCAMCLAIDLQGKHTCIENNMKSNCAICHTDLFHSRQSATVLRCGHSIHAKCSKEYIKSGHYTCPLCFKAIVDLDWSQMDHMISIQPMPHEFANTRSSILCNDCGTKEEVPFHFLGHKCPKEECGSYNTKVMSTTGLPDLAAQERFIDELRRAQRENPETFNQDDQSLQDTEPEESSDEEEIKDKDYSDDELSEMSIRELRDILHMRGIDDGDCLEKVDLIVKVKQSNSQ